MTQADHEEPSNIIFYLKLLCKAVVASALLINVFVQKTRSYCPLDQPSNITAEKAVNVVCVSVYHEHGTTQTTSTYHKKRRRTSKKLATLRDKTTRELKKIKLKQKKQCQRYWFKDENLRKDTRCKEMLIGGLEIKKSAMEAHMTQLQYYVTFSRDQLEMQRERNKIIQDNIDQCGKHVVGNNNIPSYQEGVAR
ncbi:hypothetical protein SNE40_022862 [Patella caerulea]|uniref:Uncharacterized protein n=1 Tax=Patella caerulea TaxID=87958 RepID=A0AAN8GBG4_PATCE